MTFTPQSIDPESFKDHVRAKWPDELLREGFVPFPKMLLRALPQLFQDSADVEELAVVLALADYRRRNMRSLPTIEYLAFIAGMPQEIYRAALDRLKAKKWVEEAAASEHVDGINATSDGLARAALDALGLGVKTARKRVRK